MSMALRDKLNQGGGQGGGTKETNARGFSDLAISVGFRVCLAAWLLACWLMSRRGLIFFSRASTSDQTATNAIMGCKTSKGNFL